MESGRLVSGSFVTMDDGWTLADNWTLKIWELDTVVEEAESSGLSGGVDMLANWRGILDARTCEVLEEAGIRSAVNIELNFPPKLRGARSRLYRSRLYRRRFLQVNTRWKALAEIYTMHSVAPFSNLNFFVKNRQNFFAIELLNIH